MRFLVSGATGFAGSHLLRHLREQYPAAELHGTTLTGEHQAGQVQLHTVDLSNAAVTTELVNRLQPTHAVHLAAMSSPRASFARPWQTIENNLRAQINVLEACSALPRQPRVLVVTSADIHDAVDDPVSEDSPFLPTSPYAVSKIAQDMHALQIHLARALPVIRARPFNFTGPGQKEGFVATDFAWQVARIEAGQQPPVIRVGNLAARRDFSDVRDVVRAFSLLLVQGVPGEVYITASGEAHSIRSLLQMLLDQSSESIEIQVDEARFVPLDVPLKRGDNSRLRAVTGWEPRYSLEQTLHDVLQDCRQAMLA